MKRCIAVSIVGIALWVAPAAHAGVSPVEPVPVGSLPQEVAVRAEFPVPANSGKGRRVVHSTRQLRVWVINAQEEVVRTFLVSGQRGQPKKGMYSVSSQSARSFSTVLQGVTFRFMTRFTIGRNGGNIGFHEIPKQMVSRCRRLNSSEQCREVDVCGQVLKTQSLFIHGQSQERE